MPFARLLRIGVLQVAKGLLSQNQPLPSQCALNCGHLGLFICYQTVSSLGPRVRFLSDEPLCPPEHRVQDSGSTGALLLHLLHCQVVNGLTFSPVDSTVRFLRVGKNEY